MNCRIYFLCSVQFHFDPPEWNSISIEVKDLITKMLTFEPSKRLPADVCLQHPWILKVADRGKSDAEETVKGKNDEIDAGFRRSSGHIN